MEWNLTNEQRGKLVDLGLKDPVVRQHINELIERNKESAETTRGMAWFFFFMFGLPLGICAVLGLALLLKYWNWL